MGRFWLVAVLLSLFSSVAFAHIEERTSYHFLVEKKTAYVTVTCKTASIYNEVVTNCNMLQGMALTSETFKSELENYVIGMLYISGGTYSLHLRKIEIGGHRTVLVFDVIGLSEASEQLTFSSMLFENSEAHIAHDVYIQFQGNLYENYTTPEHPEVTFNFAAKKFSVSALAKAKEHMTFSYDYIILLVVLGACYGIIVKLVKKPIDIV